VSATTNPRIAARIAARKACEEIVLLVAGEVRGLTEAHGDAAAESFWEHFRTAFEGHFPQLPAAPQPTLDVRPMDDFEIRQFEQQPLNFGQHKGKRIADVPKAYLEWLAYSDDDLKSELKRYLAAERIQQEQDDISDDDEGTQ
jgi:uncharacterized protein (DUF3820 family)